ncbi:dienelactone hydrolase family protein [Mesorhizobium sp. J8]|uniref:dienelactone hydrolase family protein n=1 Tax=Mesorhizobium sp. J8 TaxID=2777475 RepID=UPI0019152845|nr:dienelactone hydrolase family protein [Mesorhizobium sp. J8]BCM19286.1 hypothetical protein MJ8_30590 [Mesorhizobium sp. J8]
MIVLFHSSLGLRAVERKAAERMRGAGHQVITPDLYSGETASSVAEGLALMAKIGWQTICSRAREAIAGIPETAVMVGHSMGAGVISEVWPERAASKGVALLHGQADIPANVGPGFAVSVHVADPDPFATPDEVAAWRGRAAKAGFKARVFTYPSLGHFFTDDGLPDYDPAATDLAWWRVLAFLQEAA